MSYPLQNIIKDHLILDIGPWLSKSTILSSINISWVTARFEIVNTNEVKSRQCQFLSKKLRADGSAGREREYR